MPYCPNCGDEIAPNISTCPTCEAVFGPGSAWHPLAEPPAHRDLQSISEFRAATERRRQNENAVPAPQLNGLSGRFGGRPWRLWHWAAAFATAFAFAFAASGGASPNSKNDQAFLNVVIGLQTLSGGLLIRALTALANWESLLTFLGKIVAIIALGVVLSGLTMCSFLATQPWGFR